jgi:hypothetical protein
MFSLSGYKKPAKNREIQMAKSKAIKYVKHLTNEQLLERMADDLASLHEQTCIDLAHWETALEVVERFYFVNALVTIEKKKESK